MTMRREKSDDRTVPEGRRKAVPTSTSTRGGKAITASKATSQLPLFSETADSPRGAVPGEGRDRSRLPAQHAVPKSENAYSTDSSAMTMEEVASDGNLRQAFQRVESNDGAPGPDRQSVREMREHLEQVLPALRCALLDGSYYPGSVRRVWIPKAGGGERGLGIPNVVDRIVQQACTRCSARTTIRRSTQVAMASGLAGAVTRRSLRLVGI
jgi:hypothetical protein